MHEITAIVRVLDHPLIRRLIALDLERKDFVIFGSAPLLVYGIRRNIGDLDIVARGAAWRKAAELGVHATAASTGAPMIHFWGGRIEIFQEWLSKDWDSDELIDQANVVGGLRFARMADVLAYKRTLMRPKDRIDIYKLMYRTGIS